MTNPMSPRDPDAILAAWLEEGPNQLPVTTRRAIAVGLRSTRQTRRVLDVPWGPNTMNSFARLAIAAAAIVIVAGGAFYLLSPSNQGIGGPSPAATPSPTAPPSATPSVLASPGPSQALTWETFTSGRFPYRMEVPAGWVHSFPVDDLPDNLYPGEEAQIADRWDQPVLRTPYLIVSLFDPAPESIAAWMERNGTQLVADCDASDPIEISIAGTTGERRSASCMAGLATEIVSFSIADHVFTIESSAISADAATATQILDHVIETFTITGPA
jgi:hypothetical protein